MSEVEDQSKASKSTPERRENENLRLISYMEDNFTRIFSLLAPIMSFSIQNETHIRQIMFSLQHPDAQHFGADFDSREYVQSLLKSDDKVTGSSNGQTSEESKVGKSRRKTDKSLSDKSDENQDDPKAGTSTDDIKEQSSPSTSKGQQSPGSDDKARSRRKRKLNDDNPVTIHCTDCNQVFRKGDGNYTRHLKEMKCSPHGCLDCGKRFKKKSYLNTHIQSVHQPLEELTPKKTRVKDEEKELAEQLEEPTVKKTRVMDDDKELSGPMDLSMKKGHSDQGNDSFFNLLHLYETNHSDDI